MGAITLYSQNFAIWTQNKRKMLGGKWGEIRRHILSCLQSRAYKIRDWSDENIHANVSLQDFLTQAKTTKI